MADQQPPATVAETANPQKKGSSNARREKQRKFINKKKKEPEHDRQRDSQFQSDAATSTGHKLTTTVDALEAYFKSCLSISHIPVKRVLPSPTTFRGPSFQLWFYMSKASSILGPAKAAQICTLAQAYRATLVQIFGKILAAQLSTRQLVYTSTSEEYYINAPLVLRDAAATSMTNFALICQSINSLGMVECEGVQYVPTSYRSWGKPDRSEEADEPMEDERPGNSKKKQKRKRTRKVLEIANDELYPRASEINILNLDFVLDELISADSPLMWRKHIHDNCPIPGLTFNENFNITEENADEVLPKDYTENGMAIMADLHALDALLTKLTTRYTYLKGGITRGSGGSQAQLVYCDEVDGMRYRRSTFIGKLTPRTSYALRVLKDRDDLVGFLNFISESGPDSCYDGRRQLSGMTSVVQAWEPEVMRITNLP